jgi:hypothetical protein
VTALQFLTTSLFSLAYRTATIEIALCISWNINLMPGLIVKGLGCSRGFSGVSSGQGGNDLVRQKHPKSPRVELEMHFLLISHWHHLQDSCILQHDNRDPLSIDCNVHSLTNGMHSRKYTSKVILFRRDKVLSDGVIFGDAQVRATGINASINLQACQMSPPPHSLPTTQP